MQLTYKGKDLFAGFAVAENSGKRRCETIHCKVWFRAHVAGASGNAEISTERNRKIPASGKFSRDQTPTKGGEAAAVQDDCALRSGID